jgi:hypothetical protein
MSDNKTTTIDRETLLKLSVKILSGLLASPDMVRVDPDGGVAIATIDRGENWEEDGQFKRHSHDAVYQSVQLARELIYEVDFELSIERD